MWFGHKMRMRRYMLGETDWEKIEEEVKRQSKRLQYQLKTRKDINWSTEKGIIREQSITGGEDLQKEEINCQDKHSGQSFVFGL